MPRKTDLANRDKFDDLETKMMGQVQNMIGWYKRKAKRFMDLPLWDREAKGPAKHSKGQREKTNIRRKATAMWDDPPDIELALKHRDRVDRIEGDLLKLQSVMDAGDMEEKNYVNAVLAYTRMERAMLDHMREIRGCLEAFAKEQIARESMMSRAITEVTKLKLFDKHHRDRIEIEVGMNDLEKKTNAEIEAMIAEAEAVTPSLSDVNTPMESSDAEAAPASPEEPAA